MRCGVPLGASTQRPQSTVAGMSGQLGQVTLDVAEGEALAGLLGEVEDMAGNQLDGLVLRTRRTVGRLWPRWSKITFVPTASVQRTSRDTGCAGIGDLHLHPKYPVAQV